MQYLQEENVLLSCEILKTLFNLTVNPSNESSEEEDNSTWIRLISILRDLLVTSTFVPLFQDNIVWYLKIFKFLLRKIIYLHSHI